MMDVEHLLSGLNAHSPVQRKTLAEHMDSNDLTYRTRSGHVCEITKEEIDVLSSVCAAHETISLRLPIIITTDTSLSQGAWKAEGKTEVSVISKLLSKTPVREDMILFYHPHLRELQKKIPNCIVVLFVL
jgi:uncharacterized protein (UPF0216 family)